MRVRYQIGGSRPTVAPALTQGSVVGVPRKRGAVRDTATTRGERPGAPVVRRRAGRAGRLPALGATAALLVAAAGCASLDPVSSKAWRIDPVLSVQHSAIAAQGHYAVGRYLDGMRAWDKAAAAYQRAVAADPRHAEAHNGLGVALARLGRHEEAERALRRAVEIEPQRAHLRSNLGFMMLKSGRLSEALAELKAAVTIDPDDATALGNLREAVAQRERVRIGEDLAAQAKPTAELASKAPVRAVVAQDVSPEQAPEGRAEQREGQVISVPAPITTASVAAPMVDRVSVPAPLGSIPAQASQQVGVFDQPTVPAWPRAGESAISSFAAMASAAPASSRESRNQRAWPSQPAGPAVAMPVRLSALSMPVALVAPPTGNLGQVQWSTSVQLEVSNGNGARGMAAKLGKWLSQQGVRTSRLTNSRPFAQEHTTVEYRSGQEAAAWQVVHALPLATQAGPVLRHGLNADVRVILGLDWRAACIEPDACASAKTTVAVAGPAR